MTDSAQYRYWAFISYSSRDVAVAKKLHRSLESYRIPRDLVGRPGRDGPVPKKLFPVFRDREELPLASDLGSSIEDALRSSRYLIVLCSPDAARSRWVNEEVRHFKALGREDRMLAIIVSGEPNAADKPETAQQECFPPALRYRLDGGGQVSSERTEPIAGDLRPNGDGWHRAFLKAVAGITGLGFDTFVRRERQRQRRRQLAAGAAALVVLGAGVWTWDYNRLKVSDYLSETVRWGVPEGLMPLAGKTPAGHAYYYRFESRRKKVRRVLCLDRGGRLHDDEQNYAAAVREIFYREDGSLQQIDLRKRNGKLTLRKLYSELRPAEDGGGGRMQYVDFRRESQDAPFALAADSSALTGVDISANAPVRSEITADQRTYDTAGRLVRLINLNAYHQRRADSAGTFGWRFHYEGASTLQADMENLGFDGQPAPNRLGVLRVAFVRSPSGDTAEESYFGRDGRPVVQQGYHRSKQQFDAGTDRTTVTYFGTDGQPVLCSGGYYEVRQSYDPRGGRSETAYFGIDGKPVYGNDGNHRLTSIFDGRGNLVEIALFDVDGKPMFGRDGFHRAVQAYDERGNAVELAFFGIDGKPVFNRLRYHRLTRAVDARGNTVDEAYFGAAGEPVLMRGDDDDPLSYHRLKRVYDGSDNQIELAYFDTADKPLPVTADRYSRMKQEFDEHGNLLAWSFFADDAPVAGAESGCHRGTQTFDRSGNITEGAFFGVDGKPVVNGILGYHRYKQVFDERGRVLEQSIFGAGGEPLLNREGYFRVTQTFDDRGNPVQQVFFGVNGEPVTDSAGCHREAMSYDDSGRMTARVCFGIGDMLVENTAGYCRLVLSFDPATNRSDEAYFDVGNRPVGLYGGSAFHRVSRTFDARGRFVEEAFFDANEKPTLGFEGTHLMRRTYNERGFTTAIEYFGVSGEPMLSQLGFHRQTNTYDSRGDLVEMAYFGIGGEPVLRRDGYQRVTNILDANGDAQNVVYFDLGGRAVNPRP